MSYDYHDERVRADALFDMVVERDARITRLESDNATIVEDAALVADENKRLKKIAEAAVRFVTVYRVTHPYYDALLVELRAEGYMGGGE